MREKNLGYFVIIILVFGLVSAVVPKNTDQYVNDFANILTPEDSSIVRQAFMIVEENTTAQVVFVSVEHIDDDISSYATQIGQEWGVGQSDKDNGVVILYVKDIGKIWVATGYGVEGIMPDSKIGRFLDEYYIPSRDSGDLSSGITQFSLALSEELVINREELISGNVKDNSEKTWLLVLIIWIVLIFIILSKFKGSSKWWFVPLFFPSGSGRSSGFGGSGFSSGGFGGGGFGGGGAGR